jgi:hypothetical protein
VVFGFPATKALEEDAGILLLLKAIEWLHPRAIRPGSICRTGDGPPPGIRRGRWSGPEGELEEEPEAFEMAGIYRVLAENGEERFLAASLLDAGESTLNPSPASFSLQERDGNDFDESAIQSREIFWRPLVPLALSVLVVEWLFFQRSIFRRRILR